MTLFPREASDGVSKEKKIKEDSAELILGDFFGDFLIFFSSVHPAVDRSVSLSVRLSVHRDQEVETKMVFFIKYFIFPLIFPSPKPKLIKSKSLASGKNYSPPRARGS